ncbi:hypothetical protein [Treponema sp.]|uniref:hypothetical protein n=1 Tax=Treponema sp. TaxID=166 RepID=UPI00388DDB15
MIDGINEINTSTETFRNFLFDPDKRIESKLDSFDKKNGENLFDPDKRINPDIKPIVVTDKNGKEPYELGSFDGGRYGDIIGSWGWGGYEKEYGLEVHHMPSGDSIPFDYRDGPAITMLEEDHKLTASYAYSEEAIAFRAKEAELIKQGKFRDALQMNIDDIHSKFGSKYDIQINSMLEYVDKLEQTGKI